MQRKNVSTGAVWESQVGYSRAVRKGPFVFLSGTAAVGADGKVVGVGDAYAQTAFILRKMEGALKECGAKLTDVVRTRVFVTDFRQWEAVGKAHAEFFANIRPAMTLIEVSKFVLPEFLVEIEMDAIVNEGA